MNLLDPEPIVVANWQKADQVREVLRLLRPYKAKGVSKIRLGCDNDGGYVLLNDFSKVSSAISLGIGGDASWDLAMSEFGVNVYQYDDSAYYANEQSPYFIFHKARVGTDISLDAIILERKDENLILKMDIENDEWKVLDDTHEESLRRCRQIVCEFHNLIWLVDEEEFRDRVIRVFSKLANQFFVCHVHANNHMNPYIISDLVFPALLEVTFANRDHYVPLRTNQHFPTKIDMPNKRGWSDIQLGTFRF